MICTLHQVLFDWSNQEEWNGWDRRSAYWVLVQRPVWERHHLEDLGIDERIILKWILKKWDEEALDWIDVTQDKDM